MQVQGKLGEFQRLGANVVVITFASPSRLSQYLDRYKWPFRVLSDPERKAYQAFGLGSASWARLLRPRVIARYLWLMLKGRRPQMAHEDVHQLGGDFVLDRTGRVVYEYRSADPADRPDVSSLLEAVNMNVSPL